MPATIIDGKQAADQLLEHLRQELQQFPGGPLRPSLVIVQVGEPADSYIYVQPKLNAAEKIGIQVRHVKLGRDTTESSLLAELDRLNQDEMVDGILLLLPLDSTNQIDTDLCLNRIDPSKDVDGLMLINARRLERGELDGTVIPLTPRACYYLVKTTGTAVEGKRVVVVGRCQLVSKPVADLFLWNGAIVTICHSRTHDLANVCREADILLVAIGQAETIKGDWIKPGAIVIDCGTIVLQDRPNVKNTTTGDVAFEEAKAIAGFITSVPDAVGPMSVAMLMQNTFDQAVRRRRARAEGACASVR